MPNRIIKESICTSESIDQLSAFHETVFYRLIVNCDDFGRMDARPKILAAKLFPLKDIRASQMEEALRTLTSAELVSTYEVDGKPFLQMKTWNRHQQIRAKKSKYPAPDGSFNTEDNICNQMISDDCKCPRNPIQSESNPNTNTESNAPAPAREKPSRFNDPDLARVMNFFFDRINPTPSTIAIDELKGYTETLGADVVIHAFEIALDNKSTAWRYIRGILRDYQSSGLTSMEAVREAEQHHEARKQSVKPTDKPQEQRIRAFTPIEEQQKPPNLSEYCEWPPGSGHIVHESEIPKHG